MSHALTSDDGTAWDEAIRLRPAPRGPVAALPKAIAPDMFGLQGETHRQSRVAATAGRSDADNGRTAG